MLKNHFRNIKEYNNRELENLSGIRFYYSKSKTKVTVAILILFVILFMWMIFTENLGEGLVVFIVIVNLILLYAVYGLIGMILLEQPIFILDKTKLYYLKTNQWYDLDSHIFENKIQGRHNYYLTFCVKDKKGNQLLSENNWFLKDEDQLISAIKYLKIHNKT